MEKKQYGVEAVMDEAEAAIVALIVNASHAVRGVSPDQEDKDRASELMCLVPAVRGALNTIADRIDGELSPQDHSRLSACAVHLDDARSEPEVDTAVEEAQNIVVAVLHEASNPMTGNAIRIRARIRRERVSLALQELVESGMVSHGRFGYWLTSNAPDALLMP